MIGETFLEHVLFVSLPCQIPSLVSLLIHARPTGMCNGCKERWPRQAWPFLLVLAPGSGSGDI